MAAAQQTDKNPNILVIFGDDVGMWNVGAYTHGMMGRTPNIDRIFNLRMDPMELFDPHSPEWGYMGRKLFAEKLWTLIPAQGLIAAHIKSLQDWPPRQRAQSLSLQKAMEAAMQAIERAPSGMQ